MLKNTNNHLASILIDNAIEQMMASTQLSYIECTELLQQELPHYLPEEKVVQPMIINRQESDFISALFH